MMKVYQVHDDNHSAYITVAESKKEALQKVYEKMKASEVLNEPDQTFKEWLKDEWQADELDDVAQLDHDGPVDFY